MHILFETERDRCFHGRTRTEESRTAAAGKKREDGSGWTIMTTVFWQ